MPTPSSEPEQPPPCVREEVAELLGEDSDDDLRRLRSILALLEIDEPRPSSYLKLIQAVRRAHMEDEPPRKVNALFANGGSNAMYRLLEAVDPQAISRSLWRLPHLRSARAVELAVIPTDFRSRRNHRVAQASLPLQDGATAAWGVERIDDIGQTDRDTLAIFADLVHRTEALRTPAPLPVMCLDVDATHLAERSGVLEGREWIACVPDVWWPTGARVLNGRAEPSGIANAFRRWDGGHHRALQLDWRGVRLIGLRLPGLNDNPRTNIHVWHPGPQPIPGVEPVTRALELYADAMRRRACPLAALAMEAFSVPPTNSDTYCRYVAILLLACALRLHWGSEPHLPSEEAS